MSYSVFERLKGYEHTVAGKAGRVYVDKVVMAMHGCSSVIKSHRARPWLRGGTARRSPYGSPP